MLTVINIVGTRPEAIKMAPVIKELEKYPKDIRSLVCVTGQHRQMLDQVLNLFKIQPDYDLNIMQIDQDLSQLTASLFTELNSVIKEAKPDWVLSQGDTTTVMVSSLVAFYNKIHFGHVEAGLRTGNQFNPFPEEVNRRIADSLSELFFAPTNGSRGALIREGYPKEKILVTGNTVIDALLTISDLPYNWFSGPLSHISTKKRIVLITAHRRESFGKSLKEICLAVRKLALQFQNEGVQFVYPVHLNPNVYKPVKEILAGISNIHLIEPLDYLSFVHLMKRSTLILTDSGGIQEEAPSLGVPVLVMRETTERPEGIHTGVVQLIGTNCDRIIMKASALLHDRLLLETMAKKTNPYGDGKAAKRIVAVLLERANSN